MIYFNFFGIHFYLHIWHIPYLLCVYGGSEHNDFTLKHFMGTYTFWKRVGEKCNKMIGIPYDPIKRFVTCSHHQWAQRKTPYENPVSKSASVALVTQGCLPSGEGMSHRREDRTEPHFCREHFWGGSGTCISPSAIVLSDSDLFTCFGWFFLL